MRRLFIFLLMVLAVFAATTPALAQRRDRGTDRQRSSDRRSYQQQRSYRPSYRRQYYRSYRPYYRGYYGGYYGNGYYGGYGYDYGYGHIWRLYRTGIKFSLDLVPENERPAVRRGIVMIDGAEVGVVNRHDGWWNGVLSVPPGDHQVVVELEDERIFETQVIVYPGQIRHVYLRLPRFLPPGATPPASPDPESDQESDQEP